MEYDFHLFFFIALIEAIKWRIERNANSMKAIARISIKTMLGCYSPSSLSSSLCIYSNPRITGGYSKHKVNQKFRRGRCDFQTRHTPHPLKKTLDLYLPNSSAVGNFGGFVGFTSLCLSVFLIRERESDELPPKKCCYFLIFLFFARSHTLFLLLLL